MSATSRTASRSARSSIGVVAAAVIVALAIWTLARLLGVELSVGKAPTPARSEPSTCWSQRCWRPGGLGRADPADPRHAARRWPFVGSTALAISIIGLTWLADGLAGVVLICMHVPSAWC